MNQDPLSDVLRSVRLRGAVFFYVSCRDDWVAASPAASDIAEAVLPGAEHMLGLWFETHAEDRRTFVDALLDDWPVPAGPHA